MKDTGTIALSSLAFGVGAAALLGVTEVSEADPPGYYCASGEPGCYLGTYPLVGSWHFGMYLTDPGAQLEIMEAVQAQHPELFYGTQEVYGACAPAYNTCGCQGTLWVWDIYVDAVGDPSTGWSIIGVTPMQVPVWVGRAQEPACYIPIGP
jgi:hypothetical protein